MRACVGEHPVEVGNVFIRIASKKTVVEWFEAVGAENGVSNDVRDGLDA